VAPNLYCCCAGTAVDMEIEKCLQNLYKCRVAQEIDGSVYLFAFLSVATTNLYSSARAQKDEESDKAESVVQTASRVAFKSGVGLMLFLLAFARPLLALYIGTIRYVPWMELFCPVGIANNDMINRLLSLSTLSTLYTLYSFFRYSLGHEADASLVYSTLVNVLGDYLLVPPPLPSSKIFLTLALVPFPEARFSCRWH
jgi:hypothetical protein